MRKIILILSIVFSVMATAQNYKVSMTVTEKATHEPVVMGTVVLEPSGQSAVTDMQGRATINNVPKGQYTVTVRYVGFEPYKTTISVSNHDLNLRVQLTETSLALREVTVTAKTRESGASTSSVIGRQAIDHLQATSLSDVMQLIPGERWKVQDLTSTMNNTLQLRSLTADNTSAFGASIVMDGMPMSNNGVLQSGSFMSSNIVGTDLRNISADDIEEVEIVRGIPSAEYGDLTSGLVIVHSKVGVTPWQFKGKINPALQNYSLGKGVNLGKAGIVNANLDYAKAWGDPREKSKSYARYTVNLGYGKDLSRRWHTDTKLRFMQATDWNGNDPDAIQDGQENRSRVTTFGLTHNGRLQMDKPLMRTLKYTLGLNYTDNNQRSTSYKGNATGRTDIITAMETGYYDVPYVMASYLATGITESRPGNIYAKLTDDFFLRHGKTVQSFKVGIDYRYDWNHARGFYNEDDSRPFNPNNGNRPRSYSDIPGLHQLSAFAEDQFTYNINKVNRLRINFGLRFTSLQPFNEAATTALSPRLNIAFTAAKWLDLRGGVGMNSKTPGLMHLYPDKQYADKASVSYLPQDDPKAQLVNYHTVVYDVRRSEGLKNATTTKVELGVDFKLPNGRKLSLLVYQDKTPNGFGPDTEYTTYDHNVYYDASRPDVTSGLTFNADGTTSINPDNPLSTYTYFMTTGKVGNTAHTRNKGLEIDFDLGEIKALHTSVFFSGAWSETKTWSTNQATINYNTQMPAGLPNNWEPFKVICPSGQDFTRYRQFLNTLRLVTNIPQLKMVATLSAQVIWHNSNWSYTADKVPTGWIDSQLNRHEITEAMLNGYLGMDGKYYEKASDDQHYFSINDMKRTYTDKEPNEDQITWNTQARLTKELGRVGALSFFVMNALYYEPFLSGNKTTTLIQRNTGTFQFGAELSLNL